MRQALIVENPKWERFTAASDKFKALSGSAALVERGRVKEKKTPGTGPSKTRKAEPDTPEALAADLRKAGKAPEEIEKALKKFKAPKVTAAVLPLLLLFFLLGFSPAFAQQNVLSQLPVTSMTALSTNNTGAGTIGWNLGDVLIFQGVLQSTNNAHASTKSNIFLYLDANLTGNVWATNQYTLSFPTHTYQTNAVASFATITNTIGATWLRIGQQCNPNTNVVNFISLDVLKPAR